MQNIIMQRYNVLLSRDSMYYYAKTQCIMQRCNVLKLLSRRDAMYYYAQMQCIIMQSN